MKAKNLRIIPILTLATLLSLSLFGQTFTNYKVADGLLSNNVHCVAVTSNNELWFGTQDGVSHFDGTNWTNYTKATHAGLVDNTVLAIAVAANGNIWAGTSFGVSVFDGNSWTAYTTADGLGNNQVKYIAEDQNNKIWLGTISGASSFDGTNWTNYGSSDGIPFGGIKHIELASNGDLWMSSGLSGVVVYNGSTFTTLNTSNGLVSNKARAVAINSAGNKWIATANGITVLDGSNQFVANHTRLFILPAPDTLNPVEDVKIDSRGWVWATIYVDYLVTEGGVSFWDGSQWTDFDVNDGLVGPVVRRLAIDSQDNIWVATSTGVSKISNVMIGAKDMAENVTFRMYPNPVSEVLHLDLSRKLSLAVSRITLYNTAMQQVAVQEIHQGQMAVRFSMEGLQPGLYFMKIGDQVAKVLKN